MAGIVARAGIGLGNQWTGRSFKREIGVAVLLFWCVLTVKVFWGLDASMVGALSSAYGTASMSIWAYVLGAFGLDAYFKQGPAIAAPGFAAAQPALAMRTPVPARQGFGAHPPPPPGSYA